MSRVPHVNLVPGPGRPSRHSRSDGVVTFLIFLFSACVSAFVLGVAAHLGWRIV